VDVHELAPGLWYWYAPHSAWEPGENWPEGVLCAYYESPEATVLFDPLAPRGEEDEFWRALDADVKRRGLPVVVLLTAPWHDRGTTEFVERYGAEVWAHPEARWQGPALTTTADVPAGVEPFFPEGDGQGQVLFFVPQHRALVTGDVFSGTGDRFHVLVDEDNIDRERFLDSLRRLLELPVENVLIAHGDPVLGDGTEQIREALESA
jgi:hypothetical protein